MLLSAKFLRVSFPRRRESRGYKNSIVALIISILCFTVYPHATEAAGKLTSLEKEEQIQNYKKSMSLLDQAETLLNNIGLEIEGQCMLSIGNQAFCKCISEKIPSSIGFVGYVAILAKTKKELKYDTLSPQDKGVVDFARKARDACVTSK